MSPLPPDAVDSPLPRRRRLPSPATPSPPLLPPDAVAADMVCGSRSGGRQSSGRGSTDRVLHETQLKRPAQFQEVFDVTHKKKGTDEYISARARKTAESYGKGMEEKYGDKDQQLELNPEIWMEASGGARKGHVYGFGHSLGSSRVLSSCASAASHATSPSAAPAAPGGGSSSVLTMTPEQIKEVVHQAVAEAMSHGLFQMMSQGFSQMKSQLGRHPPGAAPTQQHQDGPSAAGGADD